MGEKAMMAKHNIANYIEKAKKEIVLLPDKPEETFENTIHALWLAAAGEPVSVMEAMKRELPDLDDEMEQRMRFFYEERLKGKPLAHIIGVQRFMGIDFRVGPGALIPRNETEILGNAVVSLIEELGATEPLTVIDVCTGMGNLALSIASRFRNVKVHGSDISEEAIALAKENVTQLHLQDRVDFCTGDLFEKFMVEPFLQTVDIITCNPPYISTSKVEQMPEEIREYEPREAFSGGTFGITILTRVLNESPQLLKNNGWLCFEVGLGQGEPLMKKIEKMNKYSEIRPYKDSSGNIRAFLLKK